MFNSHSIILKHSSNIIMSSPRTTYSNNAKKQKLVIIPPKQLFIDLTNEDNTTPSPPPQCSSPSAPNAPSKTPSTNGNSTSSIPSTSSINDYINTHLSPPTIDQPSQPTNENTSLAITLSLSPLTPLDAHFSSSPINPPTYNPVPWSLLEANGDTCLCCIHNRTIVFGLRDEIQYMFSHIENMLHQPPTTNTTPPPPSTNTPPPSPSPCSPSIPPN
jgi:hypothetical protein